MSFGNYSPPPYISVLQRGQKGNLAQKSEICTQYFVTMPVFILSLATMFMYSLECLHFVKFQFKFSVYNVTGDLHKEFICRRNRVYTLSPVWLHIMIVSTSITIANFKISNIYIYIYITSNFYVPT